MKTFLHVGCGSKQENHPIGFNHTEWKEVRLDINPDVEPDIVGNIIDMRAVATASVNAVFSSHNIEHLYAHEVSLALSEFYRVLNNAGFVVITCPDLQSVCAMVAQDKLAETAYVSPSGPITPLDILYGFTPSLKEGNLHMAHKCGFTRKTLTELLQGVGFTSVLSLNREKVFDLWVVASKLLRSEQQMLELGRTHFPM